MRHLAFLLALGLASVVFGQDEGQAATYKALNRFGDVLDLVVKHGLSEPKAADLVAAAVDGLLAKYPSEGAAAAAAKVRKGEKAHLDRFGAVFDVLAKENTKTASPDELADTAINALLAHLGPRNSFISASQLADMRVQQRGEFGGVGLEVSVIDGAVTVVTPLDGTPAQRRGLLPRDVIATIDGRSAHGMPLSDAVGLMRGKVGTTVTLTVLHERASSPVEIKLTRETIKIGEATHRAVGDVGYIRLSMFNERAADSVSAALEALAAEIGTARLAGFVLDLRNNPGGGLDHVVAVADLFLDDGEITSIRGRDEANNQRFDAKPGDATGGKPVVVLISGGTASGSEIISGALRDHRRATIIGSRSFGNGLIQSILALGADGADGAVRLVLRSTSHRPASASRGQASSRISSSIPPFRPTF